MIISKRFRCKFSRQKHTCSLYNCTWHVCKYSLNNVWKNTDMMCWLRVFVDKLNIVYSKRESVVIEKQKKRRLRERLNEHKQCTLNCSRTKEKTLSSRTKLSSSFFEIMKKNVKRILNEKSTQILRNVDK
jgi:hypothetical protein